MKNNSAMKKFLGVSMTAILAAGTIAGCGSSSKSGTSAASDTSAAVESAEGESGAASSGDTIKIGGTFTLTGDLAHSGTLAYEGAEAAVKYVNEELGGINGKNVELVYYDDEFDSGKIPSLYEKLISVDKVDLLVSPYTSALLDAAPTVDQYGKLMFSVAADSYEANNTYGQTVANIQMDDEWQGGLLWNDVAEFLCSYDDWATSDSPEKPKTVAIVNLETTYGHEVSTALNKYFSENGLDVVYEEFFDPGNADWTATISKLKQLDPDVVINTQYFDDGVKFTQQCKSMDYSADYMVIEAQGWDAMDWCNPDQGGLTPSDAKKNFLSYSVYKPTRDAESTKWLADYCKEKYNSVPGNDLICGFMAVELACKAAAKANSFEKDDLIKVLTENTFDLAGYDYKMNETGGNCADFSWGVGQYQPADLSKADTSGDDWQILWPKDLATSTPNLPFQGWD